MSGGNASGKEPTVGGERHALSAGSRLDESMSDKQRGVLEDLLELARGSGWDPADLLLWMFAPTTYFVDESRPVDHFDTDPDLVLDVARRAWGVEW